MNKNIIYTDEPLAMGETVFDFLPPPEKLIKCETTEKVMLELSQSSLAFFKEQAKRNHISYQQLLQNVIDAYAKMNVFGD